MLVCIYPSTYTCVGRMDEEKEIIVLTIGTIHLTPIMKKATIMRPIRHKRRPMLLPPLIRRAKAALAAALTTMIDGTGAIFRDVL